jgi:hypothetical protein
MEILFCWPDWKAVPLIFTPAAGVCALNNEHIMKAGRPQGLKATLCGLRFTARLTLCPFKTRPIQNFASARCFFGASEKQPPIPSTDENARGLFAQDDGRFVALL